METLKKLDADLFLYLNNAGSESWDKFWMILTDQWLAIPLYVILALMILWKTGFKSAVISGAMILATVVVTYIISYLLKNGVARLRPCNVYDIYTEIRFPLKEIGKGCGTYGFVSSHATVATGMIVLIGMILKKYFKFIMPVLIVWLMLFSYSRIYLGKHYPGDIIAGFIIGVIIGFTAYKLRLWIERKWAI
ncbi:MAG TPA: phosphatase PAP2 family protein [Brumimicrobium sp.]|nr:phosphatase PAP2 family protein [Brumimicrobium sp.]